MSSYLGLKEYEPIKWSEVANKISDEIASGVAKVDKAKRDASDFAADSAAKNSKYDETKIQSLNQVIFSMTQNAKGKGKEMYDRFTNGEISMSDWKRWQQNLNVSVGSYKQMLSNVSKDVEQLMERQDKASASELMTREKLVGTLSDPTTIPTVDDLGNLFFIDSTTGEQVQANLNFYEKDKYDPIVAIDNATKGIAKFAGKENGKYIITEKGRGDLEKIRKATIDLAMDSNQNIVDTLAMYPELTGGIIYQTTTSKEEADKDPSKVLMAWDGEKYVPDTDAKNWKSQKEEAKTIMEDLFDSRILYQEAPPQTAKPTATGKGRGGSGRKQKQVANRMPLLRKIRSSIKNESDDYSRFIPFLKPKDNDREEVVAFRPDIASGPNMYMYQVQTPKGAITKKVNLSPRQLLQKINDAVNRYNVGGRLEFETISFSEAEKRDTASAGRRGTGVTSTVSSLNANNWTND